MGVAIGGNWTIGNCDRWELRQVEILTGENCDRLEIRYVRIATGVNCNWWAL